MASMTLYDALFELLETHLKNAQPVALPPLGRFVPEYDAGKPIQTSAGPMLSPPSISVNLRPSRAGDTLPIYPIAQLMEASEQEVDLQMKILLTTLKQSLDQQGAASLQGVGRFQKDSDGVVHYEADPELLASVNERFQGLEPLMMQEAQPAQPEPIEMPPMPEPEPDLDPLPGFTLDDEPLPEPIPPPPPPRLEPEEEVPAPRAKRPPPRKPAPKPKKKTPAWVWVVPVLLLAGFFGYRWYLNRPVEPEPVQAVAPQPVAVPAPAPEPEPTPEPEPEPVAAAQPAPTPAPQPAPVQRPAPTPAPVPQPTPAPTPAPSPATQPDYFGAMRTAPVAGSGQWTIIVGGAESEAALQSRVSSLRQKGLGVTLLPGRTRTNAPIVRVGVGSYASEREAARAKSILIQRRDGANDIWPYRLN